MSVATAAQEHSPLLSLLLLKVNEQQLRRYCNDSIARICNEYSVSADVAVVCQLREAVHHLSFTHSLALFFLLLNIDTGLKKTILDSESALTQQKSVNFFMNLRRHVIPEFLSAEACDVRLFVERCQDAWGVA
jgi:hypothetical protein